MYPLSSALFPRKSKGGKQCHYVSYRQGTLGDQKNHDLGYQSDWKVIINYVFENGHYIGNLLGKYFWSTLFHWSLTKPPLIEIPRNRHISNDVETITQKANVMFFITGSDKSKSFSIFCLNVKIQSFS